jgi:hypothetical protein
MRGGMVVSEMMFRVISLRRCTHCGRGRRPARFFHRGIAAGLETVPSGHRKKADPGLSAPVGEAEYQLCQAHACCSDFHLLFIGRAGVQERS